MKFITSKTALLDAANMVGRCVTTSAAVPILDNFLFSLADGKLTLNATDLQTTMSIVIDVEGKADGTVAVPARMLLDVLKTLAEQPIRFNSDAETSSIEIIAGDGSFNLAAHDNTADFPKVPAVETASHIELPAPTLSGAIGKTLFAVSNDELRPAMTGVLCSLTPDAITFVATDAHKLVRYIRTGINVGDIDTSFIIPKKALAMLKATPPAG